MKRLTAAALHPSPNELSGFALGSLDERRAAVVEAHVYGCERCADAVAKVPVDDFLKQLQTSHQPSSDDPDCRPPADSHETVGVPLDDLHFADLAVEIRNHRRFAVKRLIAEGAMGRVYLARMRESSSYVAIKVMKPDIANDPRKVARFLQESRIAEKLQHPNIARVIAYESCGRMALLAMEFVRGRTLAQIVRQRGPLPLDEAQECLRQAAEGLAFAANQGVVHRDIKPHNVMSESRTGLIKIVDFGLGRLVDEQRSGSRLTREDEILGTLDYISPEQAMDSREANVCSDIYSLGCTFYFLLTGAPPFASKSAIELLKKHESERPVPIRTLRPEVPPDIAKLLDRMMEKDPKLRPQSPQDILRVLARSANRDTTGNLSNVVGSTNPARTLLRKLATFRGLASPTVLLPFVTCLICLVWLLLR